MKNQLAGLEDLDLSLTLFDIMIESLVSLSKKYSPYPPYLFELQGLVCGDMLGQGAASLPGYLERSCCAVREAGRERFNTWFIHMLIFSKKQKWMED